MQYSFCVADKAEEAGPRIYIPESRDIVSVISISEIGPIGLSLAHFAVASVDPVSARFENVETQRT